MVDTILIVEDSAMFRILIDATLTEGGFSVIQAADGAQALEHLVRIPNVRLVVCDVNMPRMGGLELLQRMTHQYRHFAVPVVMLTSQTDSVLEARAKELGARGWIHKPFRPEALIEEVRRVLGTTGSQLQVSIRS